MSNNVKNNERLYINKVQGIYIYMKMHRRGNKMDFLCHEVQSNTLSVVIRQFSERIQVIVE